MLRFLEFIFGLERGFLSRDGDLVLRFDPPWPGVAPAWVWNLILALLVLSWVVWIYRRENTTPRKRIVLATLRVTLFALLLAMLNRPMLGLVQSRGEPSVLPILIDDSSSMQVSDVADGAKPHSRLDAARDLLTSSDARLLRELSKTHTLRLFRFSSSPSPLPTITPDGPATDAVAAIGKLTPAGQGTQVARSVKQVAEELQGQHVAGLVVLTDGRDVPAGNWSRDIEFLRGAGMRVYAVPVGSDKRLRNIAIERATAQEVVFQGDLASIHVQLSATGVEPGERVHIDLKDAKTGRVLKREESKDAGRTLTVQADGSIETDLVFRAEQVGPQDVLVDVAPLDGELTTDDNSRRLQLSVLDAKVNLLYIDGYPRWEYRYLRNQMTRDKTVSISCLLTSADPGFIQEGSKPIRFFPQTMDQLLEYDVVLVGDVDPRQFTDAQMTMLQDFVVKKGGGFGMIAGPRYAPQAYRNTPVEAILPVDISAVRTPAANDRGGTQGFRPVITPEGEASPIFRFFGDRDENRKYIHDELPLLYWYARGATAKSGVGEVLAEHPADTGPDGRKAALLVVGRPGAGRTLFSAIDDSWRWRFYTGESIFDTYWVQQIRYLARGRKIGQRRVTLASLRPTYELGEQARVNVRILDDQLAATLADQLSAELTDSDGKLLATPALTRQPGQKDLFSLSLPAGQIGRFTVRLPSIAPGVEAVDTPFEVVAPKLELSDPRVARAALSQLAGETDGKVIELANAQAELLAIPSAGRIVPVQTARPVWSSPLVLIALAILLTAEWAFRKLAGLL